MGELAGCMLVSEWAGCMLVSEWAGGACRWVCGLAVLVCGCVGWLCWFVDVWAGGAGWWVSWWNLYVGE